MAGVCRLTIKCAKMEDAGEYTCKIDKQDDKTTTQLIVVGQLSPNILFGIRSMACLFQMLS